MVLSPVPIWLHASVLSLIHSSVCSSCFRVREIALPPPCNYHMSPKHFFFLRHSCRLYFTIYVLTFSFPRILVNIPPIRPSQFSHGRRTHTQFHMDTHDNVHMTKHTHTYGNAPRARQIHPPLSVSPLRGDASQRCDNTHDVMSSVPQHSVFLSSGRYIIFERLSAMQNIENDTNICRLDEHVNWHVPPDTFAYYYRTPLHFFRSSRNIPFFDRIGHYEWHCEKKKHLLRSCDDNYLFLFHSSTRYLFIWLKSYDTWLRRFARTIFLGLNSCRNGWTELNSKSSLGRIFFLLEIFFH